jgi:ATP-dependent Lon protease
MPELVPPIAELELPPTLPILVLRSAVLFPHGVIGLQVATDRSLRLVESLSSPGDAGGSPQVAIFSARSGESEPGKVEDFAEVGVVAEVVQILRLGQDRQQLFLHGLQRVGLSAIEQTEPYFVGRVKRLRSRRQPSGLDVGVLIARALESFETLAGADDRYSRETVELLRMNLDQGPELFSDLLATYLNVAVEEKQRLVETVGAAERLQLLAELIDQELARVAVDRDIQSKVRTEIEEKKREYLLREQLRIIRESLGEDRGPEREADEFRQRIDHLPLDDESKRVLRNECSRLAILSEQSAEYPVLYGYLETVFGLPWLDRSQDSLSLTKVEKVLDRNHHGVSEVKERILEYLAVANLKGKLAGPILCLAGPPGTGKTSLARSIAGALGRRFIPITLGGVNDESEIRGHRRTYVGAMPGKLIAAYQRVGTRNPLILLDEIDKVDSNLRGDPAAALLEVLDPEQNRGFTDRYLGIPFDLSETLFIATANRLDTIPGPLRDRLEVITLAGYTEEEKVEIVRRHILPGALVDHGLQPGELQITPAATQRIVRCYTSEAGVRNLDRRVAAICRKVARQRAAGELPAGRLRVADRDVERFLGPPVFEHEFAARNPEIGLATGLAWTVAGGEIMFIEAARMAGGGRVEITGHLGDVMRESVQTAYSYVRSRARELGIPPDAFSHHDVHIHFPAGSIPKDGPSAGVAVATCLASLLSGRPVRHDVAMSGEITLRGKILSVGGVKEKVLAAHRARIKTVILPIGNRKDLVDLPAEAKRALRIVHLNRIDEVWEVALGAPVEVPVVAERAPVGAVEVVSQPALGGHPEARGSDRGTRRPAPLLPQLQQQEVVRPLLVGRPRRRRGR